MTRSFLLSAACCLFGACAAPKAVIVEETTPAPAPVPAPTETLTGDPVATPAPSGPIRGGLRLPSTVTRFPEESDFKPGAAAAPRAKRKKTEE